MRERALENNTYQGMRPRPERCLCCFLPAKLQRQADRASTFTNRLKAEHGTSALRHFWQLAFLNLLCTPPPWCTRNTCQTSPLNSPPLLPQPASPEPLSHRPAECASISFQISPPSLRQPTLTKFSGIELCSTGGKQRQCQQRCRPNGRLNIKRAWAKSRPKS